MNPGRKDDQHPLGRGEAEELFERLSQIATRRRFMRHLTVPVGALAAVGIVVALVLGGVWMASQSRQSTDQAVILGQSTEPVDVPVLPRDGGTVAFTRGGPRSGIYVINGTGGGLSQLTSNPGDTDPALSPDGSRIAFVRNGDIYVIGTDGQGLTQLTDSGSDTSPSWSPDGTRIVFTRETPGSDVASIDVFVVHVNTGELTQLTNDSLEEYTPAWSPDGTRIAFAGLSRTEGELLPPVELYVMASDGSSRQSLGATDVAQPAWSPDGTRIAFVDVRHGSLNVINADGSDMRTLFESSGPPNSTLSPAWAPDGSMIVFSSGNTISSTRLQVINSDGSGLRSLTRGNEPDYEPSWGL